MENFQLPIDQTSWNTLELARHKSTSCRSDSRTAMTSRTPNTSNSNETSIPHMPKSTSARPFSPPCAQFLSRSWARYFATTSPFENRAQYASTSNPNSHATVATPTSAPSALSPAPGEQWLKERPTCGHRSSSRPTSTPATRT